VTDQINKELEDYFVGKSELSNKYKNESQEIPPAHIDDAILAAAHKAVGAKPKIAYSPFSGNWHVPASLAAVLVLCVGLVITMQQDTGEGRFEQPARVGSESMDHEANEKSTWQGAIEDMPEMEGARSNIQYAPSPPEISKKQGVSAPAAIMQREPVPAKKESLMHMEKDVAAPAGFAEDLQESVVPATVDAPIPDAGKTMDETVLDSILEEKSVESGRVIHEQQKQRVLKKERIRAKSKSRAEVTADILGKEDIQVLPGESSRDEYSGLQDKKMPQANAAITQVMSPQEWLDEIERMLKEGRSDEAKDSLNQFLDHYPDYSIEVIENALGSEFVEGAMAIRNQ
jgi:hypothetical protein